MAFYVYDCHVMLLPAGLPLLLLTDLVHLLARLYETSRVQKIIFVLELQIDALG
jgi:hypothetical protein